MTAIDSDPITTLFSETVVEFIRRNGPKATSEVACRFCWDMRDARKTLKKLEASGLVHSRLATTPLGTELEWRAVRETGLSVTPALPEAQKTE